jgi:putative salt-induced outer membrane protein
MKFSTLTTFVSAAVVCMGAGSAFAQSKTDGQWRGLAGASVSATSGNSSSTNVLLNVDMARLTAADKISTGGYINRGSSKAAGVTTTSNNKWGLNGQYDYNLSPRMYAFGKLALEGDKVVDLSLRSTLAGGLGYKVINTATTTFDVFGGLASIHSKYGSNQLINNASGTSFNTTSLLLGEESTHKLSEAVFFKQRVELYPRLSGDGGTLAKGTANLGVSLSSATSLNVGLVDTYNAAPAAGLKKNDLALFTGLSMNLGK